MRLLNEVKLLEKKINFEGSIHSRILGDGIKFSEMISKIYDVTLLMAKIMTQPEKQVFPVITSRKFSTQYPRVIKITETILYEYFTSQE